MGLNRIAARVKDAVVSADAWRLAFGVGGIGLTGYGLWLHYPPAGFVGAGTLLFAVAVIGSLRTRGE
jgi:hypothetical protein